MGGVTKFSIRSLKNNYARGTDDICPAYFFQRMLANTFKRKKFLP
jgi:hypothetical protein